MSSRSETLKDRFSWVLLILVFIAGFSVLVFLDDEALQASRKQQSEEKLIQKEEKKMISAISEMEKNQRSEFSQDGISMIEVPLQPRDENEIVFTGKRKIR